MKELWKNLPKSKHKEGYTNKEIKKILKTLNIKEDLFSEKLGVHTAITIDGISITYHSDVELSIRCCLENRDPNIFEFD